MATATIKAYPRYGQMVKGYKYKGPITFHEKYGHLASGSFPADCIAACSASGRVDDSVEYWVQHLGFSPPRDLMERYLREYGAWDDLQMADDHILAERVMWLACCEIREQGEWYGLCH